jgi:hypothetical protein
MIAYRDLMWTLIIVFSVLTIIMMPAFFFFNQHGAIKGASKKPLMEYSLGNMGYSSAQCS